MRSLLSSFRLAFALFVLSAFSVMAEEEHDRVRRAVAEGRALPLGVLLGGGRFEGALLDVELEERGSILVYELRFLTEDGRVRKVWLDAATGDALAREERRRR
jgi:hypothetical protein